MILPKAVCNHNGTGPRHTVQLITTQLVTLPADYNSEFRDKIRGETELKRTVEGRIQTEVEFSANAAAKSGNSGEYRVSEAARVKSQWEKTLNSSARNFLEQVHDDTTVQRAAVTSQATSAEGGTQKRSLREEKLELIRLKRSKIV